MRPRMDQGRHRHGATKRPVAVGRQGNPIFDYDDFRRPPTHFAPEPPVHFVPAPRPRAEQNDSKRRERRKYSFVKEIGEGAQGSCTLYKSTSDSKLVVHKVMKVPLEVDRRNKPKEATILQDILGPHPRIIELYHWTWTPEQTDFYMEYCSAGDLFGIITKYHTEHQQMIPESFIWHTYLQLAEALAFIHEGYDRNNLDGWPPRSHQPVIHRDIKPSNIFLRRPRSRHEYPDMVLADFGVATDQVHSHKSPWEYICGTPVYQGPEIPALSRAGDAWSIGACVYELAMGSPPIKKPSPGMKEEDWGLRPEEREVLDVRTQGFSRELYDALELVLRWHPPHRVRGRALVEAIEDGMATAPYDVIPLASWALPT